MVVRFVPFQMEVLVVEYQASNAVLQSRSWPPFLSPILIAFIKDASRKHLQVMLPVFLQEYPTLAS